MGTNNSKLWRKHESQTIISIRSNLIANFHASIKTTNPSTSPLMKSSHLHYWAQVVIRELILSSEIARQSQSHIAKAARLLRTEYSRPRKNSMHVCLSRLMGTKRALSAALETFESPCFSPFEAKTAVWGGLSSLRSVCAQSDAVILDDKRRTRYLQDLREWDKNPWILTDVVSEAQQRYSAQIELQKLKASELRYQSIYRRSRD